MQLFTSSKELFLKTDNKAGRRINFYNINEIQDKLVISYIKEVVKINDIGLKIKKQEIKVEIPKELKQALSKNKKQLSFFPKERSLMSSI